jgi:hypothetical protein
MMKLVAVTDTAGVRRLMPNPTAQEMALRAEKHTNVLVGPQANLHKRLLSLGNAMGSGQHPGGRDQRTSTDEVATRGGGQQRCLPRELSGRSGLTSNDAAISDNVQKLGEDGLRELSLGGSGHCQN